MVVKALISFSGRISMYEGEERDIKEDALFSDLLKAGYIEPVKKAKKGKKDES
ncbi:hypothetical protein [Velocimicrobium porci]|uniref:hypothetical protein n=1 Tax=Velocimicrobium porci TaxID=2606634 RepID=UPI00197C45DB|nr:hypothetical protein [Velocimicrobium porci]